MSNEFLQGSLRVYDPSDPRYENARRTGFRGGWFVQGKYAITDGVLRGIQRSGMHQYHPITHKEIGPALAKIEEGDQRAHLQASSEVVKKVTSADWAS